MINNKRNTNSLLEWFTLAGYLLTGILLFLNFKNTHPQAEKFSSQDSSLKQGGVVQEMIEKIRISENNFKISETQK